MWPIFSCETSCYVLRLCVLQLIDFLCTSWFSFLLTAWLQKKVTLFFSLIFDDKFTQKGKKISSNKGNKLSDKRARHFSLSLCIYNLRWLIFFSLPHFNRNCHVAFKLYNFPSPLVRLILLLIAPLPSPWIDFGYFI